jgi:tetratricopeptide (TPR) repeat protein
MPCRPALVALGFALALPTLLPAQSTQPTQPTASPSPTPKVRPSPPPPAKPSDVESVERLLAARREYQTSLELLRQHYISAGDIEKARWAEEELIQFHRIAKQPYRLDLDVPPPNLQALHNYPEANELFRRAMQFKDHGWGSDYVDNQRRAELLFQQILSNYPQSDKISDTAYQLGDIYESRAYKQYGRAASYFERCFQWNPKTNLDARLRAARLYERSLNERARAIEIYREIVQHETDQKRVEEAQARLVALAGKK